MRRCGSAAEAALALTGPDGSSGRRGRLTSTIARLRMDHSRKRKQYRAFYGGERNMLASGSRLNLRSKRMAAVSIGTLAAAVVIVALPTAAGGADRHVFRDVHHTKAFWHTAARKRANPAQLRPALKFRTADVRSFALNASSLRKVLVKAPRYGTRAARMHPVIVSLPAPNGRFERFALTKSQIMAPGLAKRHPDISTYYGRGVDDVTASIAADISHIGFHASIRSAHGGWYIDPYYRNDTSRYVSYSGADLAKSFEFVEHGVIKSDERVARTAGLTALAPTGDVLRTYRLALITDPGYANYVGLGNVTAAKVALINRVSQVYHDDISIQLQLIANNDLLNLNTWAQAIGPNGPCGAAACFTQSQVTGCSSTTRARFVIGQIIGASSYDIGHLALGEPGGGVANLGVVGRSNKAGGCTGIPTPVGDFYAIDYVAHEMGHQFSGNHPFNGNQLNCSSGNRSAATSVEPGSGSSIMAYAGICLTDDLQPHSDPYWSQRSLQEISTYTSSNQAAINEVQTVSLRHFGGGNEVQTATFGPGYAPAATIQPLTVTIGGAPSATQVGGLTEDGNTVTVATGATGATHTLQPGDTVTIAGAGNAGYNGTFTVNTVPSSRSFTYTNPTAGLPRSGGGTITLAVPGATESGTTVTLSTAAAHGRSVGDIVTVAGVGVSGYNGTFTVTAVPTARTLQYTAAASGLANSGGGSVTYSSPFQLSYGGQDSAVIGGSSQAYNSANIQAALNAIPGFPGGAVVTGAAATGFTITFSGAGSAGTDVGPVTFDNLSCGGCFGSIEETNHGGANDSFTLNYNGNLSAPIVNGTNYSAAGILAALTPLLPAGGTATVAGFGGGTFNNTGFQVTYTGTLAALDNPVLLGVQGFTAGASGFTGETDQGGPVTNKGNTSSTGNAIPVVDAGPDYTIPLRTPFALTGSATDANDPTLIYSWEQNDRGGTAGTSLLNNTKVDGPLFAMFGTSAPISESDTLLYNSPNENHLTTNPTRVFPEMRNILANNTNADTGSCIQGPIAPPVPISVRECFMDFLPTSSYTGTTLSNNASPPRLNMRFTARDGHGGTSNDDIVLTLAAGTGPFLVTTSPSSISGGGPMPMTWNVAGTDANGINTANVKISLSTDGGQTFPTVLAASTPNDGSEAVTLPNINTTHARIKVEAIGNVFFDVNNSDIAIVQDTIPPVTTATLSPPAQNGWYASPTLTLSADDGSGSGVNHISYAVDGGSFQTYSGPLSGFSTGNHFVQYFATDNAGNVEATKLIAFKADSDLPTATITRPADGASYPLGKPVKANFKCADKQTGSGLASCVGTVPKGSLIDTSTLGSHSFTVTATDKAGNQTVKTVHYTVTYTWNGFFAPISNSGSGLNLVHAGDLIKLGFGLGGDRGLNILAAGSPSSVAVACPADAPHLVSGAHEGTPSGLFYGASSSHYSYGWQTDAAWAGTCRQFSLQLNDGTAPHLATFMFFA